MRAAPTLDGRIRIDLESKMDWMIMLAIPHDARSAGVDLADRLSNELGDDPGFEDWNEFVVPDLRDGFGGQLELIEKALISIKPEEPEPIFIVREDAEQWYGGLNQARLALEERYRFQDEDPEEMTPGKRSAWFRSSFYQTLQGMLLEFLMRD